MDAKSLSGQAAISYRSSCVHLQQTFIQKKLMLRFNLKYLMPILIFLSFSQGWFSGEVETAAEEKTETEHEVQHQTEWQSHDASPLPSK